jgi:tRNA(His) guanylyltransferase
MAGSKYEYVRSFESDDALLPSTFVVVRVDGRAFTRFTEEHGWLKPTDSRGVCLMTACALEVLREWGDLVFAYGQSDEYSFVLPPRGNPFGRRSAKLATGIASLFASAFVFHWPHYFPTLPLQRPPAFDARCVVYPRLSHLADYLRWRQVDTHVNALYNECFWALVQKGGCTTTQAHDRLKGTLSSAKHELLHGSFGLNYASLPAAFRRGTTLVRVGKGGAIRGGEEGEGGTASPSRGSEGPPLPLPPAHPPLPPFNTPPSIAITHVDYLATPSSTWLLETLAPFE